MGKQQPPQQSPTKQTDSKVGHLQQHSAHHTRRLIRQTTESQHKPPNANRSNEKPTEATKSQQKQPKANQNSTKAAKISPTAGFPCSASSAPCYACSAHCCAWSAHVSARLRHVQSGLRVLQSIALISADREWRL